MSHQHIYVIKASGKHTLLSIKMRDIHGYVFYWGKKMYVCVTLLFDFYSLLN